MGVSLALLALGTAISAGGQIASGASKKKASKEEARQLEGDAARQAQMRREEAVKSSKRQKLSFIKSGIDITAGSPIMMIAETKAKGERESGFIKQRGGRQASSTRKVGRQAFTSSILGAGSTVASAASAFGGQR